MNRRISPLGRCAKPIVLFGFALLAAYAQTQPATLGNGAAQVISLSGQVTILRNTTQWALNQNDFVKPQQTIITGVDGYAIFKVSDGSTFDVYPNSRVVFRANAGDWKDLVDVYLGKIKVKIEHFGSVPNHNTVRTPTAVIAVRGTVFNVNVEDSDDTTLVLCEEGRVEVSHIFQPGKSRILEQGEWVRVFKNQPLAKQVVDHGMLMQRAFRAASDALNEILLHRTGATGSPGTSAGSSGGASGDGKGSAPAPTAGTAPPPPPPHN